jgi:hypothetical protein
MLGKFGTKVKTFPEGGQMSTASRYIVERGPDQVRTAFQGIVSLCDKKGITSVTLVVSQKGGWDLTIVAEFLGPAIAKALLKGQPVQITQKGATMTARKCPNLPGKR